MKGAVKPPNWDSLLTGSRTQPGLPVDGSRDRTLLVKVTTCVLAPACTVRAVCCVRVWLPLTTSGLKLSRYGGGDDPSTAGAMTSSTPGASGSEATTVVV